MLYIPCQDNLFPSEVRSMMRSFGGFRRKAVVVLPPDLEYQNRILRRNEEWQTLLRGEGKRRPGRKVWPKFLNNLKGRDNS